MELLRLPSSALWPSLDSAGSVPLLREGERQREHVCQPAPSCPMLRTRRSPPRRSPRCPSVAAAGPPFCFSCSTTASPQPPHHHWPPTQWTAGRHRGFGSIAGGDRTGRQPPLPAPSRLPSAQRGTDEVPAGRQQMARGAGARTRAHRVGTDGSSCLETSLHTHDGK